MTALSRDNTPRPEKTTTGRIQPVPPIGPVELVTDAQLARYATLIYQRTGIRISPQKKTLLSNRLRRRLRKTGIKSFEEYYHHLQQLPPGDREWDGFLQEITTHETYLFRDEQQWKWFSQKFLTEVAANPHRVLGKPSLRIWSAACSTGDEPLTAACCVAAALPNLAQWNVAILGTDIGQGALEQAEQGIYSDRAMRLVSEECRRRFFTQAKDAAVWQAKPAVTGMLAYRQHNLLERLSEPPFDLVFLKNVLIYFDGASKKTVMDNIRPMVRPGGMLVAGAAEGVGELLRDFIRVEPWLYRRPTSA